MKSETSAQLEKMLLPVAAIEGLVTAAVAQLNDEALVLRLQHDRQFRDRVDAMAQFILIAITCAQLFAADTDFNETLSARPFSLGDLAARQVGLQILDEALVFGRLPDAAIDDRKFDQRALLIRQSI